MAVQVCPCCCASFNEQDICCINTRYSQMVLEFAGFGPTEFCACPNELGVIIIDLDSSLAGSEITQDFTFCELENLIAYMRIQVQANRGCLYNVSERRHSWAVGLDAVHAVIWLEFRDIVGPDGNPARLSLYVISSFLYPEGNVCESCSDFLARIEGQSYAALVNTTSATIECNQHLLTWYLQ
jgi:hypothetical protein